MGVIHVPSEAWKAFFSPEGYTPKSRTEAEHFLLEIENNYRPVLPEGRKPNYWLAKKEQNDVQEELKRLKAFMERMT